MCCTQVTNVHKNVSSEQQDFVSNNNNNNNNNIFRKDQFCYKHNNDNNKILSFQMYINK